MLKSDPSDSREGDRPANQVGRTLGHYTIVRKLGEGAAASVYEAEDSRIGRKVALKVLSRPEGQDAERNEREIARFKREARTIARLSHPNIVTIYDIGEEDSDYYIVMERLAGMTLRERLDQGPIEPEETAVIVAQIASALNAIHAHDIVHRDIKPSNVMLLPNDDPSRRDWVKLLDFGIARLGEDSTITHAGTLIGSPSYMSPEQVRGEAATKLSDVWSLGVLLYELLAGTPPFKGPMITSVLYQIDHGSPAPLTGRLAGVMPVIETALAKNPLHRYTSAGAMSAALNDALAFNALPSTQSPTQATTASATNETPTLEARTFEKPVPARIPSADKDAPPAESRRPYIVAATAVGLSIVALAGTYGISSFLGSRQHAAPSTAQESSSPSGIVPRASSTPRPAAIPVATPSATPVAHLKPSPAASPIAAKPSPTPVPSVVTIPLPVAKPSVKPATPRPSAAPKPAASARPKPVAPTTPKPAAPTVAPPALPTTPVVPTPGPIEKRPEPRRQVNPPTDPSGASSQTSDKVTSAHDLLGTWTGRIHNRAARVAIKQSDGNGFSGEATITTDTGSAHFAIAGDLEPNGDKIRIAFQSVRLLSDSTARDVDFGQQSGRLIDGASMAGMGKDMQFLYTWNLSR